MMQATASIVLTMDAFGCRYEASKRGGGGRGNWGADDGRCATAAAAAAAAAPCSDGRETLPSTQLIMVACQTSLLSVLALTTMAVMVMHSDRHSQPWVPLALLLSGNHPCEH